MSGENVEGKNNLESHDWLRTFLEDDQVNKIREIREWMKKEEWVFAWNALFPKIEMHSLTTLRWESFSSEDRYYFVLLYWFAARIQSSIDDHEAEKLYWKALSSFDHVLSNWSTFFYAKALLDDDPQQAMILCRQLPQKWAGEIDALFVLIKALENQNRSSEALKEINQGLLRHRKIPKNIRLKLRLAKVKILLREGHDAAVVKKALREIEEEKPPFGIMRQLYDLQNKISHQKREKNANKYRKRGLEFEFAKGKFFYQRKKHQAALKVFNQLLRKSKKSSMLYCDSLYMKGKVLFRQRKRKRAKQVYKSVVKQCRQRSIRVKAKYNLGKSLSALGQFRKSIEAYDSLVAEFPRHRLSDDALFRSAKCAAEIDDIEEEKSRLKRLLSHFPKGDMVSDALFRLGWIFKGQGEFGEAFEYFDKLSHRNEAIFEEGKQGRALYWKGRMKWMLGQTEGALETFEMLFLQWPLSYYAQQAFERVRELDATRGSSLRNLLKVSDSIVTRPIDVQTLLENEQISRLLLLVNLGEVVLVNQEFRVAAFVSKEERHQARWFLVELLNQARIFHAANKRVRSLYRDYFHQLPNDGALYFWQQAYPTAYNQNVESSSKQFHVPSDFLWAVAREESWFNPKAVSIAKAYGLIQMLPSTAKRYAEPLGLSYDADAMKNPSINLQVGASFINDLRNRYASNPAVVPAAYNAGPGAVDKWLRERSDLDLDEWVEMIPYDETRRYTRRVLQSWGIYRWLNQNKLLRLERKLPPPYRK